MDQQFDMSFVIDGDNHPTNAVHDLSIVEVHQQADNGVKCRQIILAVEIRLAIALLPSGNDPIARQNQAVHGQCRRT